jgi:hypothetical protein
MKTVFLRLLEADNKATALLGAVRAPEQAKGRQRFDVDPTDFASVPGSPFAYWVTNRMRALFKTLHPLEADGRAAFGGMKTQADERFLRAWWETFGVSWVPLCKGGKFSAFYADVYLVTDWWSSGARPRAAYEVKSAGESWGGFGRNEAQYFRPGLTWPRRTNGLSLRAMPAGCIFGDKGPAIFVANDNLKQLLSLVSITNSRAFGLLVSLQLARTELAQSYEVGLIQNTPIPNLSDYDGDALARLAQRGWQLKRTLDTRTETSHAFTLPALLQVTGADVAARAATWSERVRTVEAALIEVQAEIDDRCFALYGIDDSDRHATREGFADIATETASNGDADKAEDDVGENDEEDAPDAGATILGAELVSFAVGVAVGRFDICLATAVRPLPPEPEPFEPLPVCSPGMLTGAEGSPLARPPTGYPVAFPENGILVDDPGHPHDLTAAMRTVFNIVFGTHAETWWNDVSALLDPKGHDLRAWLSASFFEHHLKRYSKSRRKAPILWQLGTPSRSYSVWLYAHRLTRDSFFHLQSEVVGPKLFHEERQLTTLIQTAGPTPAASERKKIAAQETFVAELRAFLDEVKRIAPLWNPNLDDGVVLTMAPLNRLVSHHKTWQKELRSKWDELTAGKYDWSHIAMHLWPERVVPACATDRSFAIAHDLEDVFWAEGTDGKWKARPVPTRAIEDLVRERTSPAVKDALASLLSNSPQENRHDALRQRSRKKA